jgi:hypothetical protein
MVVEESSRTHNWNIRVSADVEQVAVAADNDVSLTRHRGF